MSLNGYFEPRVIIDSLGRWRIYRPLTETFWPRVDRSGGPDACWPWTRYRNPTGYGQLGVDRALHLAHRVAYELTTRRPAPAGLVVMHTCDNPPCCNPAHLRLATQHANARDMADKGRASTAKDFGNGKTKVSPEAVRDIIRRRASGETCKSIADAYGLHSAHVSRITRGLRRGHLHASEGAL